MTGAPLGTGTLRRDPATAQTYRGDLTIAGFPYALRATVECDDAGRYFALTVTARLVPAHLRLPDRIEGDDAAG